MNRGIVVRMTVIFAGLLLLATATTGYMVHQAARSALMRASTERLAHSSEVVRVRMLSSVEAMTKDLRFLASTPPVQGIVRARMSRGLDPETALLDSEWRAQLAEIFRVFVDNRRSYLRLRFSDLRAHPNVLVSVGTGIADATTPASEEFARVRSILPETAALGVGEVHLSSIETVVHPTDSTVVPTMFAVVPVLNSSGDLFGVITAQIDLRDLLQGLATVVGRDKSLFVANHAGRLLNTSEGPYAKAEVGAGEFAHLQSFMTSTDSTSGKDRFVKYYYGSDGAGTPGIAYFDRIFYDAGSEDRHARLAVISPTDDILTAVNAVEERSLLIVLLFSVAGAALAMGTSQFLTRPLRRITEAISHFGEDYWEVEIPTGRSDEIGVLARAFNKMAGHIRYQVRVLEEKERRQRVILETAAEGIVVTDLKGRIEEVNPSAERMLGFSVDELVGHHLNLVLPQQLQDGPVDVSGDLTSWLAIGTGHEVVGLRRDRSEIHLSLSVSEFDVAEERRLAIFFEDIGDRKEYEDALHVAKEKAEEMAKLKTAFLANMSHELRTPLTAVIGYSSMLGEELSSEHEQFAQLIERSGRRLMDTLNAVLSLAQLESQEMAVELKPIELAPEVEETAGFFEAHAASRGLAFRFSCTTPASGVRARVDRGALNSVLQNLIGNAIKFTESGFVEVRVHAANERVFIEVRDTGIGIDSAFLPYLFEEFRQESTGMERSHEGSGLGLALTSRLVKLMGGEIQVDSKKGEGATFTVSFPIVSGSASDDTTGTTEARVIDPLELSEAQILVVEDNPETAFLARRSLSVAGDVTLAFSVDEALRKARRLHFDLIVCDINLGTGSSGIDLLHEIREMEDYADVPVVALTAYALPGDEERFLRTGFDDYVAKPFTPQTLVRRVFALLTREQDGAASAGHATLRTHS